MLLGDTCKIVDECDIHLILNVFDIIYVGIVLDF